MKTKLSEVQEMVRGALSRHPVKSKELQEELKAIQWRLRGPRGEHVGLVKLFNCAFVPESESLVFDGRDNEAMKLRVYELAIGVPLTIEVLPQLCHA